MAIRPEPWELSPDEDVAKDPVISFGIIEAQKHRARGVTLSMFLGLMKYYRQSFQDLVEEQHFPADPGDTYHRFIDRFFDRVEIGFCMEWANSPAQKLQEELQSANRTLTNEKNDLTTILNCIPNPIFLLDNRGKLDGANQSAGEIFSQLKTDEQKQSAMEDWAGEFIRSGNREQLIERKLDTRSGPRHFQVRFTQFRDATGRYGGMIVVMTDLTERKQKEDTLLRFRQLLDQTSDLVFVTDLESGRILDVNETACQALGYTREELLALRVTDIELEAYRFRPRISWLREIRQRKSATLEGCHRRKDGTSYPVEMNVTYHCDNGSECLLAIGRDITSHKAMEEKLSAQLLFWQTLLDSITVPMFVKNTDFQYLRCNQAFADFLGVPKTGIIGKTAFDLLSEDQAQLSHEVDIRVFQERQTQVYEATMTDSAGKIHEVIFTEVPLFDSKNLLRGLVSTILDVTEAGELREDLRRVRESMNQLNREIETELHEKLDQATESSRGSEKS